MAQGERAGIGDAGRKGRQKLVGVFGFPSESADDGEVDVLREAGLTPALEGQAPDETEAKPSGAAELLNLQGRRKDGVHEAGGR
jgi:hypothetical protein